TPPLSFSSPPRRPPRSTPFPYTTLFRSSSRNLFVAVGIGSVLLALALGLVLSWSLVAPIQRIGTRLAEIAAGDFSRHVEVSNRRSEEHTSELQSLAYLVCRLLLEKKKQI